MMPKGEKFCKKPTARPSSISCLEGRPICAEDFWIVFIRRAANNPIGLPELRGNTGDSQPSAVRFLRLPSGGCSDHKAPKAGQTTGKENYNGASTIDHGPFPL